MQKIKYITNRELLSEIHNSKNSYCSYLAPEFANFDLIVASLDEVTPELFQQAIENKAAKLSTKLLLVDPASLDRAAIVIRLMSDTHLPAEADEKRRKASSTGGWVVKTNFPPFQHFIIRDGVPLEVGRSHWFGGLENGGFTLEHGGMSDRLASMFMLLVERYSRGGSWRAYTYNDEMRSHALVQLSQVGLQFNESRSDNPFSFYTQIIKNCFRRILNLERRAQDIRDDLLIMSGAMPSYTRQVDNEMEQRDQLEGGDAIERIKGKRGRKPKVTAE